MEHYLEKYSDDPEGMLYYSSTIQCIIKLCSKKGILEKVYRYTLHSSCFLNNCRNKSHPRYVWAGKHVYDFPSEVPDFPEEGS